MPISAPTPGQSSFAVHHIPILIYLPYDYPMNQPEVYVTPTDKMELVPNRRMDSIGRVWLDSFSRWSKLGDNFNYDFLLHLIDELESNFQKDIPVALKQYQIPMVQRCVANVPPVDIPFSAMNSRSNQIYHEKSNESDLSKRTLPSAPVHISSGKTQMGYLTVPPLPVRKKSPSNEDLEFEKVALDSLRSEVQKKLERTFEDIHDDLTVLIENEFGNKKIITDNSNKLSSELAELQMTVESLKEQKRITEEYMNKLAAETEKLDSFQLNEANVESLVDLSHPDDLILEAHSTSKAIDDLISMLSKALYTEKLEVNNFIKLTRIFSKNQFICKAAIEKISGNLLPDFQTS